MSKEINIKTAEDGSYFVDIKDILTEKQIAKVVTYSTELIGEKGLIIRFYDENGEPVDISEDL